MKTESKKFTDHFEKITPGTNGIAIVQNRSTHDILYAAFVETDTKPYKLTKGMVIAPGDSLQFDNDGSYMYVRGDKDGVEAEVVTG
ncbi:hypothetical protein [uncultured Ilyobacter sp.]|uniref:hypothetical protein n=1 Tax=uncultured Ilyobacter sp. TaxID=544433 RepID=UPI0029C71C9F|nr:hypothetical protein [uncultured Ilyobacter sp.]